MSIYAIVLFLHVLGAIGVFVGMSLEGFVLLRLRRSSDAEEIKFFVQAFERLKLIYIPSFIGILFGGLYLASVIGSKETLWIAVALGATLLMAILGGAVTGSRMGRIQKALSAQGDAETLDSVIALTHSKSLLVSYGLRFGLAIGIVFLMTVKPDLVMSFIAVTVAALAGMFGAAKGRRPSGIAEQCVAPHLKDYGSVPGKRSAQG